MLKTRRVHLMLQKNNRILLLASAACLGLFSGCATKTTHSVVAPETVASYNTTYTGPKSTLVVGNFDNRSDYARGLFATAGDPLGNQAKTVLKTHLQQTNRFKIVDRDSSSDAQQEAKYLKQQQTITGARYAVTGAVTEFGRKEVGDKQLFGILGSGKQQIAYSKVLLNVVDVLTSEIVHTTQGAGEYALSEREVLGFGSNAGYDSTLNGKVLDLAVREAINNLVRDLESGRLQLK